MNLERRAVLYRGMGRKFEQVMSRELSSMSICTVESMYTKSFQFSPSPWHELHWVRCNPCTSSDSFSWIVNYPYMTRQVGCIRHSTIGTWLVQHHSITNLCSIAIARPLLTPLHKLCNHTCITCSDTIAWVILSLHALLRFYGASV